MSALWANLLNEAMTVGERMTMAEIYGRVQRSQNSDAYKVRKLPDMVPILQWARDEEGGVEFERRPNNGYTRWTRTREIIAPPEEPTRTDRMTIIKHDFPTQSAAVPRANPITVPAYPWEAVT